jgi:hypothetical protein
VFRGPLEALGLPRRLLRRILADLGVALTAVATFLRASGSEFVHGFSAWVQRYRRKRREESSINLGEAPTSTGVVQTYQGFVDAVHDGMAYLSLETVGGHRLALQWDARELAAKSIGERQPFVLQTLTSGDTMRFEFAPDALQPLSVHLLQEIDDLTAYYRATGELDGDDE